MGIHDREYYRDETRGSGFFTGVAPACKAIILINVAVFFVCAIFEGARIVVENFGASGDAVFRHFQLYRLITASFIHVGLITIAMQMMFLWLTGREMEHLYGTREFVAMFLTAATVSNLARAIAASSIGAGSYIAIGSEGAVTAVIVLFALYYPHREVMLFGLVRLEVWMLLILYFGLSVLGAWRDTGGGPAFLVAIAAEAGGGAYAYLYRTFDLRWSRLLAAGNRRRPTLRVFTPEPRDKVSPVSASSTQARSTGPGGSRPLTAVAFPEEQLDARLDEVLAKIAREGKGGLTEEENRVLQEASQRARNRRSDRL